MYKMMLVEDEPMVLDAMTNTIDWKSLGFHPPVSCAHGQQAIDRIEQGFLPDAVITDINMPFVDGIGLAEYLADHAPGALVVILTGYDDFAYAHKAIKLKVFDYVLKPITPANLRQLGGKLREVLDERRIKELDKADLLACDRFFSNLLTTQLDAGTVEENLRVHQIHATGNYWTVMAADLNLQPAVTAEQSRNHELLRYGLENIAAELALKHSETVRCLPVRDTFCIILNGESARALGLASAALSAEISEACRKLDTEATCGIGGTVDSTLLLHNSYLQAVLALHYRFFYGSIPCIRFEDVAARPADGIDIDTLQKEFAQAVRSGKRSEVYAVSDRLFQKLMQCRVPYDQCLRIAQRLVLQLIDLMGEFLSRENLEKLRSAWENANFYQVSSLPELHKMFSALCDTALDDFELASADDAALRVRKAQAYIHAHYNDETLSLNTIKEEFSISISYFSAIFKAGTGSTFVEYLTQVRIDKAKHLLRATEQRTAEIAEAVGFADPHYFSITFKRIIGMTPREYRIQSREVPLAEGQAQL